MSGEAKRQGVGEEVSAVSKKRPKCLVFFFLKISTFLEEMWSPRVCVFVAKKH